MSTKTNFKRIALVAVAALGLGVLSSVPAQAVANLSVTITNGTFVAGKADSSNAATIAITAILENTADTIVVFAVPNGTLADSAIAVESVTVGTGAGHRNTRMIQRDSYVASARTTFGTIDTTVAGAGSLTTPTSITRAARDSMTLSAQNAATAINSLRAFTMSGSSVGNIGGIFEVQVDSVASAIVAGTYSYTVFVRQYTQGVASPVTTTYPLTLTSAAVASVGETPSAVTSFARLTSGGLAAGAVASASSDAVISALATTGTTAGYIFIGNRNSADGSATAEDSLTAVVTGAGLVCTSTTGASQSVGICGKSVKVKATGDYQFALQSDGTGGASSVTVTSSVAGWVSSKSLNYYLAAAKTMTATVAHPLLKVGTNDGAVRVVPLDANGTAWTGTPYIVASAAADALVGGSATTPVACTPYSATLGYAACNIATLTTGTAKFKVIDASTVALATATSNEVTVTVTNATPATVKLSFDKATYAPNERARIYITPLDAAGKEMQSVTADLLASGGITVNGAISYTGSTTTADSLIATSITTSASTSSTSGAKAGSMVYTVYMPSAGGTVSLSATGGTGLPVAARVAVTASATVTDSGAAALAAVNALATTVASLRTLITTLTNLVLKIQKKVKA